MYNSLRLMLVLALAPMLAMAQAKDSAPCPDVTIDLSGLRVLEDIKLENLADLQDLKQLAVLENLSELAEMKNLLKMDQADGVILNLDQASCLEAEAALYDVEKRKTVDKTFKVSSKDMLSIDNEWGKVHVNTWDKKEIRVKVDVIARASTDAKAQEILDNIKILESQESNTYSFRTKKAPMRINGHNNKSLEINYTIYMPSENAIAIKNRFGDVYLASMTGKADIDIEYGSLKSDRLTNTANNVKITYGSANCGYINGGKINVAFGDVKVAEADDLQGSSKFSDFSVGSLEDVIEMEVQYGSFKIDNISKNIRKISLNSGFTPLNLKFAENTNFNFDVNVQFGNFKVDKSLVTITSLEKDYTSAEYKGRFGGTSPKGLVSINSKYGDVKFTK